jgi:nitrite reductase/ring-hydroxylating ferredoxin subunit
MWVEMMQESAFDGDRQQFVHENQVIDVFRLDDGYYAIADNCSHAAASLLSGTVENGIIECPHHGALFDVRTGKNRRFPAVTPVKSYPVKVENGTLFLDLP